MTLLRETFSVIGPRGSGGQLKWAIRAKSSSAIHCGSTNRNCTKRHFQYQNVTASEIAISPLISRLLKRAIFCTADESPCRRSDLSK